MAVVLMGTEDSVLQKDASEVAQVSSQMLFVAHRCYCIGSDKRIFKMILESMMEWDLMLVLVGSDKVEMQTAL